MNPLPIFLSLFIVFCLWLHYEKYKSNRNQKQQSEQFWKTEHAANLTRKKDISSLDYVSIDFSKLPTKETDSTVCSYLSEIETLSKSKLINLRFLSNTQIKLTYGAANLPQLSLYDENYQQLLLLLNHLGVRLVELKKEQQAISVLEYAVSLNSDISQTYLLLGTLYHTRKEYEKLKQFYEHSHSFPCYNKQAVQLSLHKLLLSASFL